jgi:hypothetical protein
MDEHGKRIPIVVPTRDIGLTGVQVSSDVNGYLMSATTLHAGEASSPGQSSETQRPQERMTSGKRL